MVVMKNDTMEIRASDHVVLVRQAVRKWAIDLGFSLVDQTKMITAASELARNALDYGGGGTVRLEALENGHRRGLRLTFEDQGPGIPDIDLALQDGGSATCGLTFVQLLPPLRVLLSALKTLHRSNASAGTLSKVCYIQLANSTRRRM